MEYKIKISFAFIALVLSFTVSAKEFILKEWMPQYETKTSRIHLFKHDGAWMNEACFNDKAHCPYYSSSLPEKKRLPSGLAGHPSADYCSQFNAPYAILNTKISGQKLESSVGFCLIDDRKYIIQASELFKKRNWGLHERREGCDDNSDTVSFNFDNLKVMIAFKVIADFAKLKKDIDPSIDFSTAMTFQCIPWQEVVQILANKYNLTMKIEKGVLHVSK